MSKRKTWREKLADDKDLPKVVKITGKMTSRWGKGTVAIAAPREIDAIMRKVPEGQLITINEIRELVDRRWSEYGIETVPPASNGRMRQSSRRLLRR